MAAVGQQRKSPEVRREPLRKWVPDPPFIASDELAGRLHVSRPRMDGGRLDERKTPLAQAMVEGVPTDGQWYLAAVCYSSGEATALASAISRGQYARGVEVACGLWGDRAKKANSREHYVVLLRRRAGRRRKAT